MSNTKQLLFYTLTPSDIRSIIFLAYSAGIEIGKAKEKTSNLMSDVGRGVIATLANKDANHYIGVNSNNDPDRISEPDKINEMSSFGMNLIEDLCKQYGINSFLK